MTTHLENPLAGSGFAENLGLALIDWGAGQAIVELAVTPKLGNRLGMAHGGVIASLLDQALGLAWRSIGTDRTPGGTINLNVNFIAPGKGVLRAHGRLIRFTNSSAFCEGMVYDAQKNIIASAQAVFSARLKPLST